MASVKRDRRGPPAPIQHSNAHMALQSDGAIIAKPPESLKVAVRWTDYDVVVVWVLDSAQPRLDRSAGCTRSRHASERKHQHQRRK